MNWTTTRPTRPGYYWVRSASCNPPSVVALYVYHSELRVFFDRPGRSVVLREWTFQGEWYGPLEVPA